MGRMGYLSTKLQVVELMGPLPAHDSQFVERTSFWWWTLAASCVQASSRVRPAWIGDACRDNSLLVTCFMVDSQLGLIV